MSDRAENDSKRVAAYVAASDKIAVLTGVGISTESGIPGHRCPFQPAFTPLSVLR